MGKQYLQHLGTSSSLDVYKPTNITGTILKLVNSGLGVIQRTMMNRSCSTWGILKLRAAMKMFHLRGSISRDTQNGWFISGKIHLWIFELGVYPYDETETPDILKSVVPY